MTAWLTAVCLSTLLACAPVSALEAVQEEMSRTIEGLSAPAVLAGEGLADLDLIADFYTRRQFRPAWTEPGKADQMLALIAAAEGHGLSPEDYHSERLRSLLAERRSSRKGDDALVVQIDLLLTDALARLGYHLRFGKVDPYTLDPHWNFSRALGSIEPVVRLQEAIDAASIAAYGQDLVPQLPYYKQYQELLKRYRGLAAKGGWPSVPAGPTLDPGAIDARVPALHTRLLAEGYLAPGPAPDSDVYDAALQAAVTDFQRLHGLQADGRVGKATLDVLNIPVTTRIDQIRVNMERVRWVFRDLTSRFLIVNVAGGSVTVFDRGQRVWTSRAIVGKPYRATPIFKADMTYLVLNPTWTVPPTIFRQDVLPKIKSDPGYLAAHEMDVIDGAGRVIDPLTVSWQTVQAKDFPYAIRQRAGATNPLGRIKFMFPNPYSVYLHDTSAPELFDRPGHTFSSGCIRVESPLSLAEWILKDSGDWDPARLRHAVDSGKTETVLLPTPLTVMLLYWTVTFDAEWKASFLADVYNRDDKILAALNTPFLFEPVTRIPRSAGAAEPGTD